MKTGWIFPDGTSYPCDDGFTMHDLVVMQFIRGLKSVQPDTFATIQKEIDDLWDKQGSRNFYANYAINRLGWIKVGSSILHNITYAGYDWQSGLIEQYVEDDYTPQNRGLSSSSYLPLNCDIRLILKKGGANPRFL